MCIVRLCVQTLLYLYYVEGVCCFYGDFQSFKIISDVVSVVPLSCLNLFIFLLSFFLKFETMNCFSLVPESYFI